MKKIILYLLPVLIIMITIFCFSAQPAKVSTVSSNYIVEKIVDVTEKIRDTLSKSEQTTQVSINKELLTFIVRKLAHTFEYAVLGVSLCFFFYYGYQKRRYYIISFIVGVLYATSDEIHQYFVPGRSCEFRDVCIDSSGVFLGILFFYLLRIVKHHHKKKKMDIIT